MRVNDALRPSDVVDTRKVVVVSPAFARHRGDAAAIAGLAAAVVGFFWQLLFLPGVVVPRGGGDLVSFLYPAYSFAAENIQRGVLPLWNPLLFSGSPFAADMQSGLFYPPNMVAFLVARPFTYQTAEWLALTHYFVAAMSAYLLGRGLGLPAIGAFGAGLVYAFGGFNVAHLAHLNMLAAAAWLPLVLLLFHLALARSSFGWAAGCGAAFGVAILAGHTQISLYTALLLAIYYVWFLLGTTYGAKRPGRLETSAPTRIDNGRAASGSLLRIVVVVAVAFGVAAVQLVPLAELLQRSLRADLTYARALEFAASPLSLITLLVPHFFGDSPAQYWGLPWSLTEVYGYAGVVTLMLAGLAAVLPARRERWWLFFALLAPLSLLLSLGEHTVLYGWLYRFVPGFDKVRAAGRFIVMFDLALALLAGRAVALLAVPMRARWRPAFSRLFRGYVVVGAVATFVAGPILYYALLTSQDKDAVILRRVTMAIDSFGISLLFGVLGIVLLAVYRRKWRAFLPYGAVALIALDLFSANAVLNPTTDDVLRGFDHPGIVSYLRHNDATRIDSATGIADVWQPDAGMISGIGDVLGLYNPMTLADYQTYWENLGSRSVPGYDLLAAGYLVARKDATLDRNKFQLAFDGDKELNVYRNIQALPRAFFASAALVMPRSDHLARLRSPDFSPHETVLLDGSVVSTQTGQGEVLSVWDASPNEVRVRVSTREPSYMVLADTYYPGWRAYVDGHDTPVLRGDYSFRAVLVPAGASEVRLVFAPVTLYLGVAVTAFTFVVLIAAGVLYLLRIKAWVPRRGLWRGL